MQSFPDILHSNTGGLSFCHSLLLIFFADFSKNPPLPMKQILKKKKLKKKDFSIFEVLFCVSRNSNKANQ